MTKRFIDKFDILDFSAVADQADRAEVEYVLEVSDISNVNIAIFIVVLVNLDNE